MEVRCIPDWGADSATMVDRSQPQHNLHIAVTQRVNILQKPLLLSRYLRKNHIFETRYPIGVGGAMGEFAC